MAEKKECLYCTRFRNGVSKAMIAACLYEGAYCCAENQSFDKQPHGFEKPTEYQNLLVEVGNVAVLGTDADIITIASFPGVVYVGPSKENPAQNMVVIKKYSE